MTNVLFAMLRNQDQHEVRRVPVSAQVQAQLDQLFESQEQAFTAGITEDVPFDGMYKPDKEEILFIDDQDLTAPLREAIAANPTAIKTLDIANMNNARVQFLFRRSTLQQDRIVLQRFSSRQYLSNSGLALILKAGTYQKLVDPGFSLDDKISAYVVGSKIYFKSFFQLRTMLTVQEHFTEATEPQVEKFSEHDSLLIDNKALFTSNADQTCRRLVGSIQKSGVLDTVQPEEIVGKANELGLALELSNGRIRIPEEKKEMKLTLRFLEQSVFKGVLTEEVFLSNSKRPVN